MLLLDFFKNTQVHPILDSQGVYIDGQHKVHNVPVNAVSVEHVTRIDVWATYKDLISITKQVRKVHKHVIALHDNSKIVKDEWRGKALIKICTKTDLIESNGVKCYTSAKSDLFVYRDMGVEFLMLDTEQRNKIITNIPAIWLLCDMCIKLFNLNDDGGFFDVTRFFRNMICVLAHRNAVEMPLLQFKEQHISTCSMISKILQHSADACGLHMLILVKSVRHSDFLVLVILPV